MKANVAMTSALPKFFSVMKIMALANCVLLVLLISPYIFIYYFIPPAIGLYIKNESGEKILFQSCFLNDIQIGNCHGELENNETADFHTATAMRGDNSFKLRVFTNNRSKQYSCSFKTTGSFCEQEAILKNDHLECNDPCLLD